MVEIATLMAIIAAVVRILVAAGRSYQVPRRVRLHDERVGNRNEDLRCWLEETQKQVRREFLRIWAAEARRADDGPDFSVSQCQKVKKDALSRYETELRDAQRVIRNVDLHEHLLHRLVRRFTKRPIPELTAPEEHSRALAEWETSAEDDLKTAMNLRAEAERRRAAARKSPLRPLRLAEVV